MSKSSNSSAPQTVSTVAPVDDRVGVDGYGNRVLQQGSTDLGGGIQGGNAPISAQSFSDTGDVFAPQFNFGAAMPYDPLNPGYDPDSQAYSYDTYQSPLTNTSAPVGGGSAPASTNFGGAAQTGGVVTGGNVSGPVASGSNSIAQQVTGGGAAVAGNNYAPVITNPGAGPVLAAGGDLQIGGSIFTGNNAPISITDGSEEVVSAALDANAQALNRSLDFANKSLLAVSESQKDPSERVSSDAFKTVAIVAVLAGVLAWANNRKAA